MTNGQMSRAPNNHLPNHIGLFKICIIFYLFKWGQMRVKIHMNEIAIFSIGCEDWSEMEFVFLSLSFST